MNTLFRHLVPISLMGLFFCLLPAFGDKPAARSDDEQKDRREAMQETVRQIEAAPTKKLRKTDWAAHTLEVQSASSKSWFSGLVSSSPTKSMRVLAKKARCCVTHTKLPADITVMAFVTDQGAIWLGPEQEFYVQTESGVVGGKVWGEAILWCESLINTRPNEHNDIDTILARFEKDIDGNKLAVAYNGGPPPPTESYLKRLTDLGEVLGTFYGARGPNDSGNVVSVRVEGHAVQLGLKGDSATSSATIVIDITTKQLLKAIVDGKQTFPK